MGRLLQLREGIETQNLDAASIVLARKRLTADPRSSSKPSVSQVLAAALDSCEQVDRAQAVLQEVRGVIERVSQLSDVVSVRLADFLSAVDDDLSLAQRVLCFVTQYYGSRHPRSLLQRTVFAIMMGSRSVNRHSRSTASLPPVARQIWCR